MTIALSSDPLQGDMAEEHINQLDHLRTADAEEYHHVKVKLETELQVHDLYLVVMAHIHQNLEQQLQTMKATLQLNSEKLDYNFQVESTRCVSLTWLVGAQKARRREYDYVDTTKTANQPAAGCPEWVSCSCVLLRG